MPTEPLTQIARLQRDNTALKEAESKMFQRVRTLERELKNINKEQDSAASVREAIYRLSAQAPKPPKWIAKPCEGRTYGRANDHVVRLALGRSSPRRRGWRGERVQPHHCQAPRANPCRPDD